MRRATLALVLAVVLALSGCGGDNPKPRTLPKPSKSSAAPARTDAPRTPSNAKTPNDAGAEFFARHFVALINYASVTGNSSALDRTVASSCDSCRRVSERIRSIYGAGGKITGGEWRVTRSLVVPDQPLTRKYVDLSITQSPQTVVESVGKGPQKFAGGEQSLSLTLRRQGQQWQITRMALAD